MTRRDFLEESFRELVAPFMSGLRFLTATDFESKITIDPEWKKIASLLNLNPGDSLESKEYQLKIVSDEKGIRVLRKVNNKEINLQIEIRKTNELWVNLKKEWEPGAFLCHLTLQKKEE